MKWIEKILVFAYDNKESSLELISDEQEFIDRFKGDSASVNTKISRAYEKAWDARKHEIDNYWKRTTYFWAFQVTSFTAYTLIINSQNYNKLPREHPFTLFFSISIGLITAIAWALVNIGSKFWQRHWEKQIDMLEDENTGPLYKTIYAYNNIKTFSVSKINEIVSRFFIFVWLALGINYILENLTFAGGISDIAYVEIIILFALGYFILSMFKGFGRGRFGISKFSFYSRKVFDNESE